jgi:UDP-galactopyranose mutase
MLDGIKVELGVSYSKDYEKMANKVIYTGPIDEYYNYEHGELDFRTLQFTKEVYAGDKQGNAVVNYTDESPSYIRSIEHRHFYRHGEAVKHYGAAIEPVSSVVTYDCPVKFEKGMDPFYPIRDKINSAMYAKYAAIPNEKVSFGGRLGEYKYLDMDQSAASALAAVSRFEPRMAW